MDTQLVEKIVHEVKSQGVFDEFRKDSMADVDTKPAYQNLRQRVENNVKKFLAEQKWTPDTNKNQLREKLKRHITESGFLDVGVERIVDQVVNPKIGSVFQPRIEEIAYNYLGLPPPPKKYEQPPPPLMHPLPPLPLTAPPLKVETCSLLPTDLEQVSPDSDKATVKSEAGDDKISINMEIDDKTIDDEDVSPPFEPLVKQELEPKEEIKIKMEEDIKINEFEPCLDNKNNIIEESNDASIKVENLATDNNSQELSNFNPDTETLDKEEASQSMDARISQESQLSSVSSDSRLSVNDREESLQSSSQEAVAANISEEAQMPKFNENSSEPSALNGSTINEKESKLSDLHFDIKKDEIKFEGTERKCNLKSQETSTPKAEDNKYPETQENSPENNKNDSFKFSSNNSNMENKEEKDFEVTPQAQDSSFGSSIDDSSSVPAYTTPRTSAEIKEPEIAAIEEKSPLPLPLTPKQLITPTTTPVNTPTMPTPTATPSPIASQKLDKDQQSSRNSSSSSSKHKKHSKERKRSPDREKDKERHHRSSKDSSSKDSYSKKYYGGGSSSNNKSSKHSSSSTTYSKSSSSSHNKSSNEKDLEKSSSSSTYSSTKHSKHSHSSSSSNEHNDSKKSKSRESERRHHSSSSSNKEHSTTATSSKRSEKKDDHNEAKHKSQRRKSTDSNDDDNDKSLGGSGGKSSSQYKSNNSSSSASKSSKSKSSNELNKSPSTKTNDSLKDNLKLQTDNEMPLPKPFCNNNVIILNDLLENPQTQFIQLDKTGHLVETPLQIEALKGAEETVPEMIQQFDDNKDIDPITNPENTILNSSSALIYFEEVNTDFSERIKLLDNAMDLCRRAVNSLRFDSQQTDEGIELSNEEDLNSDNSTNLLTQTLKRKSDVNYEEYEKTPRKRVASNESEGCSSKTSPTPSYSSVNSKENEEIYKNTDVAKKSLIDRHKAVQKLSQQQRYSSEDLYKPRPVLGQRSRRRGMDSLV